MDQAEEQKLIKLCQTDPGAYGRLFDEFYPRIFAYIFKRVGDPAIAEDIVADTFLKGFMNIKRFKWKGVSVSTWFYKIATNELRSYFRRGKHGSKSLEELYEIDGFEPASDQNIAEEQAVLEDLMERRLQYVEALSLLMSMPLKYQEVISLRYVEKKKISEIALILDKKEGTIKSLLSRGISNLRQQLSAKQVQPNFETSVIPGEALSIIKSADTNE